MKKTALLLVCLLVTLSFVKSQTVTLNNVKSLYLRNVEAIIENEEVKGYLAFYLVEKKNSKENNFKLVIYDNNLTPKFDINLLRPSSTYFMESAYNGERFCYSFLDAKEKTISYLVYDKEGKKIGSQNISDISRLEMAGLGQKTASESNEFYGGLLSVPGKGFVRYNLDNDKGKTSLINFIDNNGAKGWSSKIAGDDKNDCVTAMPLTSNADYIISQVYVRESMMSQSIKKMFIRFQKTTDGTDAFTFNCKGDKHQWSVGGVTFEGDDIFLFGEYFAPEANIFKDESDGLFLLKLDKTGKIIQESYNNWTSDIEKLLPNAMMNEKGKRCKLTIHKIIKCSDGKIYAIGEQFRQTADALGIATNVVGGGYGASTTKISTYNMIVLEFDSQMKLTKGQLVEKSKSQVYLAPGLEFYGSSLIASYLKATGQFDYCFTTVAPTKATFNAVYVNYDREKESQNNIIGNIALTREGKIVVDKVPVKEAATSYIALPAKSGYVGVMEYYKKKKSAVIRLEKLNL